MHRFAGNELGDDRIPDETTILHFRHLPERHDLAEVLFEEVNAHLADKGIGLSADTLVDATIIPAPSSTKNEASPSSALFADNCPIPPISSRQAIDLVDVEFRFSNVVT